MFRFRRPTYRRRRPAYRRRAKTRVAKMLAPRTRKAVASIAKTVLNRKLETNYAAESYSEEPINIFGDTVPSTPAGGGVTTEPQMFGTLPAIVEGSGSSERKGDRVNPVRHVSDLTLWFNNQVQDVSHSSPLDNCAWDITVHVWYGTCKRYKRQQDVLDNRVDLLTDLLEDGAGGTLRWDGSPAAHEFPVNTEVFNVKHKKFRMFRPAGDQNTASVAGGVTTYFPSTITKQLRLSYKIPKVLKYADNGSGEPEDYAPFVIVAYQHNDSTQAANGTGAEETVLWKPALQMMLRNHIWYKDA